ncbi:MAG: dTDP-4-dehydrorhamnose reductase [Clostridiales Family XIII bacterium]|jgi:dTDP-4-dehydrorhamnose reductase|nr:dTDP-4-dehydrorhamnose reductase [Clostridiales Family XIII bacterium]
MQILITGSYGQLGTALQDIIEKGESEIGPLPESYKYANVTAVDYDELDITDTVFTECFVTDAFASLDYTSEGYKGLIINCAAMTNVDACETDYETAMKVNAIGARNLAAAAAAEGVKYVHVSTDYVFAGDASKPYCEWDTPNPATVYGKSKLLSERYVRETCPESFVVRTSWLYSYVGNNFVKTMVNLAREKDSIKVVDDQVGNPTHAYDLAHHILKLADTDEYGIYHCTGEGICSWYEFAKEIIRLSGETCEVIPCTTEEFPRPAPRPAYSAMENLMLKCTVGNEMRPWQDALASYFKNSKE